MSEAEFANMYIERILNEVTELTKMQLINETKITYLETVNGILAKQIQTLESQIMAHEQAKDYPPEPND